MKKEEKQNKIGLEEFSQSLISVGKEIGGKLSDKERLEEEVREKEAQVRKLQIEIFEAQRKLAKLSLDLSRLEEQRKRLEEQKPEWVDLIKRTQDKKV
jgi:predicted nuclease with TOPRIM domain